jgi:hypothetical protein
MSNQGLLASRGGTPPAPAEPACGQPQHVAPGAPGSRGEGWAHIGTAPWATRGATTSLEREADQAAEAALAVRELPTARARPGAARPGRRAPGAPTGLTRPGLPGGRPLPAAVRARFEPSLGRDLGDVRVHTGTAAARAADALHARAFTTGHDVVFAAGEYAPETPAGQRLIAHELAHVAQQAAGGAPAVQRQPRGGGSAAAAEEPDAGAVILEGLKIAAGQAKDNNPKVKREIIQPLEREARRRWGQLSTGEQGAVIGFGAGTAGLTLGALLADPAGREVLSGVNLAAPLGLVPYVPLTHFSYTLPTGTEGPERLLRFRTAFSGDELLGALRARHPGVPPLSMSFGLDWGYDAVADRLTVLGGQARLGILRGIALSGGTFTRPPAAPEVSLAPGGGLVESRKRLPEPTPGPPRPGFQVMLTVDLLKLDRSVLPAGVRQVLEAF